MNEIKNFSKCELNQVYNVNGKALIIERVSTHKNGHYLYTCTIDGEVFTEQNSPQLKKLLGMETIKYNREGGNGGGTPRISKEITEDSIKSAVDARNLLAEQNIKCDYYFDYYKVAREGIKID